MRPLHNSSNFWSSENKNDQQKVRTQTKENIYSCLFSLQTQKAVNLTPFEGELGTPVEVWVRGVENHSRWTGGGDRRMISSQAKLPPWEVVTDDFCSSFSSLVLFWIKRILLVGNGTVHCCDNCSCNSSRAKETPGWDDNAVRHLVRQAYFYCLCIRTTSLLRKGNLSHCWFGRLYIPCKSNVLSVKYQLSLTRLK